MASEISETDICENAETQLQMQCLSQLKKWVEEEAEFNGRSDNEFLLMHLYGCKFNMEKAKKKMTMYYENRKRLSYWWADRDITDPKLHELLKLMMTVILIEGDSNQPTVVIIRAGRVGPVEEDFNPYAKLNSIVMDMTVRRRNSQHNGVIWIVDCAGYRFWFAKHFLSLMTSYNMVNSYYLSVPLRVQGVHFLNSPFIATVVWTIVKPMLSAKLRKRVHFYKSNWSQLHDRVPVELLPEEYGGLAGPLDKHESAFEQEIINYNDYLLDDNKYGFPKEPK